MGRARKGHSWQAPREKTKAPSWTKPIREGARGRLLAWFLGMLEEPPYSLKSRVRARKLLFQGGEIWHEYQFEWESPQPEIDLAEFAIESIKNAFTRVYRSYCSILLRVEVESSRGISVYQDWRTVTQTLDVETAFEQFAENIKFWGHTTTSRDSKFTNFTGIGIYVKAPKRKPTKRKKRH